MVTLFLNRFVVTSIQLKFRFQKLFDRDRETGLYKKRYKFEFCEQYLLKLYVLIHIYVHTFMLTSCSHTHLHTHRHILQTKHCIFVIFWNKTFFITKLCHFDWANWQNFTDACIYRSCNLEAITKRDFVASILQKQFF